MEIRFQTENCFFEYLNYQLILSENDFEPVKGYEYKSDYRNRVYMPCMIELIMNGSSLCRK